jgi:hypothetical protein
MRFSFKGLKGFFLSSFFTFCIPGAQEDKGPAFTTHPESGCRAHLSMTRRDKRCLSERSSAMPQHLMKCPSSNYSAPSPPRMARPPPPPYWREGLVLYGQLKEGDCEDDLPGIEVLVFNCLVLGPKGMNQAENGRLLSFDPPPLLCIGTGDIKARVAEQRRCSSFQCTKIFFHIKRGLRRHSMT